MKAKKRHQAEGHVHLFIIWQTFEELRWGNLEILGIQGSLVSGGEGMERPDYHRLKSNWERKGSIPWQMPSSCLVMVI